MARPAGQSVATPPRQYEVLAVAILCLAWGVVNAEIFGINYLLPFVASSLKLSNTQIGIVVAVFFIPFALSSYLTGNLTDRRGNHKTFLLCALLLFSVASVLTGLAGSFLTLIAARLLMGLLEGPILPLAQSIVAFESAVQRRGMNMGIVASVGSAVLGWFVAPLLLVHMATRYGWRSGFFILVIPGLICSALVARFLREPSPLERVAHQPGAAQQSPAGLTPVLRYRNVWLCAVCASVFMAYTTIGLGFLPLFFIKVRHFPPQQMSLLMSVLGIANLVLGIALPALSDRIGRKPVAIAGTLLGMLCPLAVMYGPGPMAVLALLLFVGWAPGGTSTLFFATIPSESVPARSISTAMGLILGVSSIGGVAGPTLAGWSADHWGLTAPMLLLAGCAAVMGTVSLALQETAPGRSKVDPSLEIKSAHRAAS